MTTTGCALLGVLLGVAWMVLACLWPGAAKIFLLVLLVIGLWKVARTIFSE